jgi:hypothetical protein
MGGKRLARTASVAIDSSERLACTTRSRLKRAEPCHRCNHRGTRNGGGACRDSGDLDQFHTTSVVIRQESVSNGLRCSVQSSNDNFNVERCRLLAPARVVQDFVASKGTPLRSPNVDK